MPDDPFAQLAQSYLGQSAPSQPVSKIHQAADLLRTKGINVPDDVVDDFDAVTGHESGRSHFTSGGQVKRGVATGNGEQAIGYSQVMPSTARPYQKYGLDPFKELDNIAIGLSEFQNGADDPIGRRIAYVAGPKAKALGYYKKTGEVPDWKLYSYLPNNKETFKDYVNKTGGFNSVFSSMAQNYLASDPFQASAADYVNAPEQTPVVSAPVTPTNPAPVLNGIDPSQLFNGNARVAPDIVPVSTLPASARPLMTPPGAPTVADQSPATPVPGHAEYDLPDSIRDPNLPQPETPEVPGKAVGLGDILTVPPTQATPRQRLARTVKPSGGYATADVNPNDPGVKAALAAQQAQLNDADYGTQTQSELRDIAGIPHQATRHRELGKPTDDTNRVAFEYAPKAADAEGALREALLSSGDLTTQQVDSYIAQRRAAGTPPTSGPYKKGQTLQVPYSVIAEIKGEDAVRADIRTEQAQAAPGLVTPKDLHVGKDWVKEDADWLNTHAGMAAVAANPLALFLPEEERNAAGGVLIGGAVGSGGRSWDALAGIARPFSGDLSQAMRDVAKSDEGLEANTGNGGIVSTLFRYMGGAPGDFSRLYLISKIPGVSILGRTGNAAVSMAIDQGLQSAGRQESLGSVAKQTGKGLLTGGVFGAAPSVGKLVEGFTGGVIPKSIATLGTIFKGTAAVESLFGTPDDKALQAGLVNTLFHLATNGVELRGKTVKATDPNGKEIYASVDPEGSVKLLKGQVEHPDVEMYVDSEGVYRAKGDTSPVRTPEAVAVGNRGNRIGTAGEPAQLAESNAQRIENPDPAAVQRAATDTRARKIADALQGKDFTTIDELAKATRLNKTNVEDAVMTLYGARQVELLPGNRVRLINADEVAKQADIFERAKTYGQDVSAPTTQATDVSANGQNTDISVPPSEPVNTAVETQAPTETPVEGTSPEPNPIGEKYKGQVVQNPNSKEKLTFTGEVNENGNLLATNTYGRQRSVAVRDAEKWLGGTEGTAPVTEPSATETPEPQLQKAEAESKPEPYNATVHRGISEKTPVDEGMYGKGEYWTTNDQYAGAYGKTKTAEVNLQNPFIGTSREWATKVADIRKQVEAEGLSLKDANERTSQLIRQQLESEGHDGIVIKTESGDEVVVFDPTKSIKAPGQSIPTPAAPEKKRKPTATKHKSLSQFVRAHGGIKATKYDSGEHQRISNKETGTTGLINKNSKYTAEQMAEIAWEAGYLRDEWPEIADRNGNDLMGFIEDDLHGIKKHWPMEAYEDFDANIAQKEDEYYAGLDQKAQEEQDYQKQQEELLKKQVPFLADPANKEILERMANGEYSTEAGLGLAQNEATEQYHNALEKAGIDIGDDRAILRAYAAQKVSQADQPTSTESIDRREPQEDNGEQEPYKAPANHGIRSVPERKLEELTPSERSALRRSLAPKTHQGRQQLTGLVGKHYGLSESELAKLPALGEVGEYGQISHVLKKELSKPENYELFNAFSKIFTPEIEYTPDEFEEFANRGDDAAAILDTIAEDQGFDRSSKMDPFAWQKFLDRYADDMPDEAISTILSALEHQATWHRNVISFTEDPILDEPNRQIYERGKQFGWDALANPVWGAIRLNDYDKYSPSFDLKGDNTIKKAVLAAGIKYGTKDAKGHGELSTDVIKRAYLRAIQRTAQEQLEKGTGTGTQPAPDRKDKEKVTAEQAAGGRGQAEELRPTLQVERPKPIELPAAPIQLPPVKEDVPSEPITDFGEKIGGARKDTAESGFVMRGGKKSEEPHWMKGFVLGETPEGKFRPFLAKDRRILWESKEDFDNKDDAVNAIKLAYISSRFGVQPSAPLPPEFAKQSAEDADAWLKSVSGKVAALRDEHAQLLAKKSLTDKFQQTLTNGSITVDQYNNALNKGLILDKDDFEKAEAVEREINEARSTPISDRPEPQREYEIYRRVGERKRHTIKKGFESREDALKYIVAHPDEFINYKPQFPVRPHIENIERTGKEYRTGNVSVKQFIDQFGFTGGEFGNWVPQDERQRILNMAYDGLMDLADVLKVPPSALSLGGQLSIAFGSRGHGLAGAAAHYERDRAVFNLTRLNGAGSVAHEWFHALDHYLGTQNRGLTLKKDDKGIVTAASGRDQDYLSHRAYDRAGRKELVAAFRDLIQTIYKQPKIVEVSVSRYEKQAERIDQERENAIKELRNYIERDYEYARKTAPATVEQLRTFDHLINRIKTGDLGEEVKIPTKSKWAPTIDVPSVFRDLNNLAQQIRGRSELRVISKTSDGGRVHRIASYTKSLVKALAQAEHYRENNKEEQVTPTKYSYDAKDIDRMRSSEYWSTEHEMAARAFEAYVEDQIKDRGDKSQYLVHSTYNSFYKLFGLNPYPAGVERERINAAFDKFINTLESQQDDQGNTILFTAQPNLFGGTKETVEQKSLFDFGEPKTETSNLDKKTSDYLTGLTKSPDKDIRTAAQTIIGSSKYANGDKAKKVIADAVDALDAVAKARHIRTDINSILAQQDLSGKTVGEQMSKRAKDFAYAIEAGTLGRKLNEELNGEIQFQAAWHGSPHTFDKFDSSKIGTGEGAQAYGHGLYFTDAEEVADHYKKDVTHNHDREGRHRSDVYRIGGKMYHQGSPEWKAASIATYAKYLERTNQLEDFTPDSWAKREVSLTNYGPNPEQLRVVRKYLARTDIEKISQQTGAKYKVDLKPEPDEYLLWDKPLSEQSEKVKKALAGSVIKHRNTTLDNHLAAHQYPDIAKEFNPDGELIYGSTVSADGRGELPPEFQSAPNSGLTASKKAASDYLRSLGIRGIKYLDGDSRHRPIKDIKKAFLSELPEDADFDDVLDIKTFDPDQKAFLKALADDDWLGFDYPAQAISAALGKDAAHFDVSPELKAATEKLSKDQSYNYVIFDDADVSIEEIHYDAKDLKTAHKVLAQTSKSAPYTRAIKAKYAPGDGILQLDPNALTVMNDAIRQLPGYSHVNFTGAYLNANATPQLQGVLNHAVDAAMAAGQPKVASAIARAAEAVEKATNKAYGDLILAVNIKEAPDFSRNTMQEELSHRNNGRSGAKKMFAQIANTPAIKKSLANLGPGYDTIRVTSAVDEVIAKSFRDDAETELNLTADEIWSNLTTFWQGATDAGIDLAEYEQTAGETSATGKRFAEYGKGQRQERNVEAQPERAAIRNSGTKDTSGTREGRTDSGTRTRTLSKDDGVTGLRREGVSGKGGRAGDRLAKLRQAELSTADAARVKKASKGDTALAKDLRNDILFAQPKNYARVTVHGKTYNLLKEVTIDLANSPRAIKASSDLSAAGRQGLISSINHPIIATRAFAKQLTMLPPKAGAKKYEQFKKDLDIHPFIELAEASDLHLTSMGDGALSHREEAFMSKILGDDPYFKNTKAEGIRKLATFPVRASERAYVTFLDYLRINQFASLAKQLHQYNLRKGQPDTQEQYTALASWVNNATGRGDLGRLNDAAPVLNAVFFSTRFWASRLQVMNPAYYAKLPPGARKLAVKEMLLFVGAVAGLLAMLKAAGASIETGDEDNPDLVKLRIGNYSYDFTAGLIGHARYAARMIMAVAGKDKRDPLDTMMYLTGRYGRAKLAPIPSAVVNSVQGQTYIGEPTSAKEEALGLLTPIMADNFRDSIKADGTVGAIKMAPEFFGISTTRYANPSEYRQKAADEANRDIPDVEKQRRIKLWNKLADRAVKYQKQ